MRKFATRGEYIAGAIIALFVLVGTAWAVAPSFRADGGVRMAKSSSAGTTPTAANPVVWSDNATRPNLRFGDGTSNEFVAACAVTTNGDICSWNGTNWVRSAGGGVSWPLSNGTSTNTISYGGTDGASAVANRITSGVNFATDGDELLRIDANGSDWVTLKRSASQNAITFSGNANASGSGPLFVVAPTGSAGVTLDATAGGGRTYQVYSTSTGLLCDADITASANRWCMDSDGAKYPFTDNANNLGLPSKRPADVYTYKVDTLDTITQNVASVTGQQVGMTLAASTAATSSGTQSNSPALMFRSQAWNTSALAGQTIDWKVQAVPTAGNPVTGQLSFYSNPNATGDTERFRITPTRATALNGFVVTQGFAPSYRAAASTITVTNADRYIGVTGTGARTVNLPAGSTCLQAGQEFVVQEQGNDAGTITINRSGSDTINGATTTTISAAYGAKTLVCNGSTAWFAR